MDFDMHSPVLLVGGGGHCRSVLDILRLCRLPVAGVVHGAGCDFEPVLDAALLGRDADLPALRQQYSQALVTVGQIKSPAVRQKLFTILTDLDFQTPTIISPLAYVSCHARVGKGTVVMHQALINAGAKIGSNCIINTKALVEHDCIVENHCHISVGAILCGNVHVGAGSFVGAGAVIMQGTSLDKNSVVCMGSVVR